MDSSPAQKLALVFSGGGAKGAFGVGVLRGLLTYAPDLKWDIVSGTSTGALITSLASLHFNDPAAVTDLERLYRTVRRKHIVRPNVHWYNLLCLLCRLPRGWYNAKPLRELIRKNLPRERLERLRNSPVAAIVNAVSLQTGDLILCTQPPHEAAMRTWFEDRARRRRRPVRVRFLPFEDFPKAMLASAAIPGAIEPVPDSRTVEGRRLREELVDGGVIDIAPLRAALAAGATHVVVVLMSPLQPPPEERPFDTLVKVAFRSIDLLTDEVLRGDVAGAREVNRLRRMAAGLLTDRKDFESRFGGENAKALEQLAERRAVEVAVIEPPKLMGDTLDFDTEVPAGWPGVLGEDRPLPIMEARYQCGIKVGVKAVQNDPDLKNLLDRFRPTPSTAPALAPEPRPLGPA